MNISFIIAVVSLTLQFGTTAALLILGRAPRWRQVRWFAAVAFTAGCYSTVDAIAALRVAGAADVSWSLRLNILFGTLHGAAWLIFTRVGRDGRVRVIESEGNGCGSGGIADLGSRAHDLNAA